MYSSRKNSSSNGNIRTTRSHYNTLGEDHLSGTFSYTMQRITNLGIEVERLKTLNNNLAQKIAGAIRQKENIASKNLDIELEIAECQNKTDQLLKKRIEKENELLCLKKDLEIICKNWDCKKKELELEISNTKEKKVKVNEEQKREKMALDNQRVRVAKYLQTKRDEINNQRPEVESQYSRIHTLRTKEINSKRSIAIETERFRKFLDSIS